MKKITKILIPSALAVAGVGAPLLSIASCGNPTEKVTVSFVSNGGTTVEPISVAVGSKIKEPAAPVQTYYTFEGWYTDEGCTQRFDFNTPITKSIVLYANWTFVGVKDVKFNAPTKYEYNYNEPLSLEGMRVILELNDGNEVDLDKSTYTVEPAEGTPMTVSGSNKITITLNTTHKVIKEFFVNVKSGIKTVHFETVGDFSQIVVGDTISKNNFNLTAEGTDGKTYVIAQKDFDLTINGTKMDSYTFKKEEGINIVVSYKGFWKDYSVFAKYDTQGLVFSTPTQFLLPFHKKLPKEEKDTTFESVKELNVYDKFGAAIPKADLSYKVLPGVEDKPVITVDNQGVIRTQGLKGEDEIQVWYKDKALGIIKVKVDDKLVEGDVSFVKQTSVTDRWAYFKSYQTYDDNDRCCVIPDYLVHKEDGEEAANYPVYLDEAKAAEKLVVSDLYLPGSLFGVTRNAFNGSMLRRVFFDGTPAAWENLYYYLGTNWAGRMLTYITCCDKTHVLYDNDFSIDTSLQAAQWRGTAFSTIIGTGKPHLEGLRSRYTMEMDCSAFKSIPQNNVIPLSLYNDIVVSHAPDSYTSVETIELEIISKDGDHTFTTLQEGYHFTVQTERVSGVTESIIHFDLTKISFDTNTIIRVIFQNEFDATHNQVMLVPNASVSLIPVFGHTFEFKAEEYPTFEADEDRDSIYGVLADGTEYEIPREYWFDETTGECLFAFEYNGHEVKLNETKFTQDDYWSNSTLKVTDKFTGSTGECKLYFDVPGATPYYNVEFVLKNGTMPSVTKCDVPVGWKIQQPKTDPVKEGHTFKGWFSDAGCTTPFDFDTEPAKATSVKVYAKWEANPVDITFDSQGGSAVSPIHTTWGSKITKPTDPTLEGKIFAGWYIEKECKNAFDFSTPVTKTMTLYAKWRDPEQLTVSFDSKGGSSVDPIEVTEGQTIVEPEEPTREGFTFGGWYEKEDYSGNTFDFTKPITQSITLYAKWIPE